MNTYDLVMKTLIEGKLVNVVIKRINTAAKWLSRYLYGRTKKIEQNKIVFVTSRGSYYCNPKAIAEEIIRQKLPWKLVWCARKEDMKNLKQYPLELKIVERDSFAFFQELVSAKIWVDNSINLSFMQPYKKKKQVLFETWHGSIGLKRFDTSSNKKWKRNAKKCGKRTDYCLSNSTFESELFRKTYWKSCNILEFGHARNDILLTGDAQRKEKTKEQIREFFGIEKEKKIALYAPTFRDSLNLKVYEIDYARLTEALQQRFGGEWCVLTRLHFEVKRRLKVIDLPEYVIDATAYSDIQDLLLIADVGITDYSSWICDYVLLKRPAFIFALDLDEFYEERGFLYPLDTTPFPIARSNEELVQKITEFNLQGYQQECEEFIAGKGCVDDGCAAERTVDFMKTIIEQD